MVNENVLVLPVNEIQLITVGMRNIKWKNRPIKTSTTLQDRQVLHGCILEIQMILSLGKFNVASLQQILGKVDN